MVKTRNSSGFLTISRVWLGPWGSDADLLGPAVEHGLVAEDLEPLGTPAVPDEQQQVAGRSPHGDITFDVFVADFDGAVGEPDPPLAITVGRMQVQRARDSGRHATRGSEGQELVDELVDTVDGHVVVD